MTNRLKNVVYWAFILLFAVVLASVNAYFRMFDPSSSQEKEPSAYSEIDENGAGNGSPEIDQNVIITQIAQTVITELTADAELPPQSPVLTPNPPEVTEVLPESTEIPQPPTEAPQIPTEAPPEPTEVPPEPVENPQQPIIVAQLPTPAGNFVNNASFDEGTSRLPSYWEWLPYTGACSKWVYDDAANAHTGSKFLATGSSNDYPACLGVYQDIYIGAINPGDYYTMSIWLKSPWQPQDITYHLEWTGGTSPVTNGQAISLNNTWQCFQVGLYIPNPGDNTHFRVSIDLPNRNLDVNIDDVLLYPGELKACP